MNCTIVLKSLKQIKPSSSYHNLSKTLFLRKCKNIPVYNFQQCQTLGVDVTQLQVSKEIVKSNNPDLKQFKELSKSGPSLRDFLQPDTETLNQPIVAPDIPYVKNIDGSGQKGKYL